MGDASTAGGPLTPEGRELLNSMMAGIQPEFMVRAHDVVIPRETACGWGFAFVFDSCRTVMPPHGAACAHLRQQSPSNQSMPSINHPSINPCHQSIH